MIKRELIIFSLTLLLSACGSSSESESGTGDASSANTRQVLTRNLGAAIDDEYKARATYAAVLAKFGEVNPFANIMMAEQQHIERLRNLYSKYSIDEPIDQWSGKIVAPSSVQAACQLGVSAEIENGKMYDRLLKNVTAYADVIQVFKALQSASLNRHLPTFRGCS